MREFLEEKGLVLVWWIIPILLVFYLGTSIAAEFVQHEYTCVVSEKYVKNENKGSKYLVVCDNQTYKITDDWFRFKFNSSDIYSSLKVGTRYRIETNGWRVPILSEYENINKIDAI